MKNSVFNSKYNSGLKYLLLNSFLVFSMFSCTGQTVKDLSTESDKPIVTEEGNLKKEKFAVGAARYSEYLDFLLDKNVAVVANQTSRVEDEHLVDFLIKSGVKVKKVFSPEHGFRGDADAGAKVNNSIDEKTGLPITSLYGKNKKPTKAQLNGIDIVVFDIQDVGARFYTYISTLHYVMEACAENGVKVHVLDRPNPNGHIVDGPVREKDLKSFVGMHRVPICHGLTIAEYAKMINEESWLANGVKCDLTYTLCAAYKRTDKYVLPIAPSPNLRSAAAIALYPSLCLFEGTPISVGRGTERPFEVYGHPNLKADSCYSFTPKPSYGAANPKLNGKLCFGEDLKAVGEKGLDKIRIDWLIKAYNKSRVRPFFTTKGNWFDKLSGSTTLREQIETGWTEKEIRASWEPALNAYKEMRKYYLLY